MKTCKVAIKSAVWFAALIIAVMAAVPAWATPLTMATKPFPDLMSSFITVSYLHGDGSFNADGYATEFNGRALPDGYTFHVGVFIDSKGSFSSGNLDVYNPDRNDHLLTGDLAALGYASGDPTMQFLFNNVGGSLAPDYGSEALVTLSYSGFETAGNGFLSDWDNGYPAGNGAADINAPAVPEPSTVSLLLLGAGGLFLNRRRRKSNTI